MYVLTKRIFFTNSCSIRVLCFKQIQTKCCWLLIRIRIEDSSTAYPFSVIPAFVIIVNYGKRRPDLLTERVLPSCDKPMKHMNWSDPDGCYTEKYLTSLLTRSGRGLSKNGHEVLNINNRSDEVINISYKQHNISTSGNDFWFCLTLPTSGRSLAST